MAARRKGAFRIDGGEKLMVVVVVVVVVVNVVLVIVVVVMIIQKVVVVLVVIFAVVVAVLLFEVVVVVVFSLHSSEVLVSLTDDRGGKESSMWQNVWMGVVVFDGELIGVEAREERWSEGERGD